MSKWRLWLDWWIERQKGNKLSVDVRNSKIESELFTRDCLDHQYTLGAFKICHHDGNENVKKAMARLSKQQLYDVQHALIFVHFFTVIPRLGREIAQFDVLSTTWTYRDEFLLLF